MFVFFGICITNTTTRPACILCKIFASVGYMNAERLNNKMIKVSVGLRRESFQNFNDVATHIQSEGFRIHYSSFTIFFYY